MHASQDLHVCAVMIQLHGKYQEALGVYRHALEVRMPRRGLR